MAVVNVRTNDQQYTEPEKQYQTNYTSILNRTFSVIFVTRQLNGHGLTPLIKKKNIVIRV